MRVKKIESPQNPVIKEALEVKRKGPGKEGARFLIEGPHLIEAALRARERVRLSDIFFTKEYLEKEERLMASLGGDILLYEVSGHVMKKLSDTKTPQGIVAAASYTAPRMEDIDLKGIIVVSDGIQEPGNLGTIIRTSDAAGAKAVFILFGSCDPFLPKAMRATAGSIFNVPVLFEERASLISRLKKKKIPIAVTLPAKGISLFEAALMPPVALVFGNESGGISPEMEEAADIKVRIPIIGAAESLNVASAAAICIYEALRGSLDR